MRKAYLLVTFLLAVWAQTAHAQTRRVTGRVLDETGYGLPGAGISVKGNPHIGTATDGDGNFQLDVPVENNTLIVQAISYTRQEVTLTGNNIVVRMKVQANVLNETVVTALGIRKEKKSLGYSVSDVNSETIEKSGEQNVVEALAVKTPGTTVTSSSGTPGASSQILLRGHSTFTGNNEPLFVVDGIPIDNSTTQPVAGDYPYNQNLTGVNESNRALDINPADIESISVLRGPAAAALYGSRGGNGAIIITTKKGKYGKGKNLGITYSSSIEVVKVNKLPKLQDQYLQGNGGKFSTYSTGPDGLVDIGNAIATGDDIIGTANSWGPRKDTAGMPTYNKYKDFFRTGMIYNNNLSITGGSENAIFRLSLGNTTNKGIVPNSKYNRTTVNFSGETKLSNWLTVGAAANYTNSNSTMVQNGSNTGGVMLTLLRAPINYDINNYYNNTTNQPTRYFGVYDNPLFTVYNNPYTNQTDRFFGNVYANAKLSDNWSINWKVGTDEYSTQTRQIFDIGSTANDAADGTGQINRSTSNFRQLYSDFFLKYDKYLTEKLELNAFIGYNFWYQEATAAFERGRNLLVPGNFNFQNTQNYYVSNSEVYQRTQAIFGEATLGYNSRFYLTVTGRNDWTTAFGPAGRSLFYPKADLSYVFSESIPKNDILSYGKIRVAYSDAGTGPDPYTYIRTTYFTQPFITDGYTNGAGFPYLGQGGYAPSNINYVGGLVPADVEGRELGLEFRLLKSRVGLEIVGYDQISHNNLINRPVAPSSGFQYEYTNAGEIQNKGIELSLNVDIIKSKDFQWTIGGNWTRNRSKVLDLVSGVNQISIESGFVDIGSYAIVGQPYGVFYGSAWQRDPATGKILVDEDGQALVDPQSKKIGDPNPKWTMGINNSLTFKGFNFSFLIDIRHGGDIWNGTWARLNRIGMTDESADRNRTYVIDGVYAPGTPNAGQQNTTPVSAVYYYQTFKGDGGNYAVENAIQDGSWVRLRSVNLSYRFDFRKKHEGSVISYLDLGITGRNLILITKYKGVDPETSLTGAGSNIGGWDYFNNPGTKSVIFSARVGL